MKNKSLLLKIHILIKQLDAIFEKGHLNKNQFNNRIDLLKQFVNMLDDSEPINTEEVLEEYEVILQELNKSIYEAKKEKRDKERDPATLKFFHQSSGNFNEL